MMILMMRVCTKKLQVQSIALHPIGWIRKWDGDVGSGPIAGINAYSRHDWCM